MPLMAQGILVDTDWLAKNRSNSKLVIVDTSDQTQHLRFHIPGAVHIDYSEITYQPRGQKFSVQVPNQYFIKFLGQKGISNTSQLVIYDDIGGLNAGRLFWQLEQIGHKGIKVLNGGLVKWILEGRQVTNKETVSKPVVYNANSATAKDNLASLSQLTDTKAVLIDARTKDEYIGYPKYPRTGHIPNAVHWDWQDNVDFANAFTLKNSNEISKYLHRLQLEDKARPIITYCQSGHRASQTYLTLRNMGFTNVKIYDGSMAEYSKLKQLPLEKGCTKC